MKTLYHITDLKNLQSIAASGLNAGSYWSETLELASYYEETIIDDGNVPLIITIDLNNLDTSVLEPDYPGLEEPISTIIGLSEEKVWSAWERSAKSWKDSLNIINSLRVRDRIPAGYLNVEDPFGDMHNIQEYALLLNNTDPVTKMNTWLEQNNFNRFHKNNNTLSIVAAYIEKEFTLLIKSEDLKVNTSYIGKDLSEIWRSPHHYEIVGMYNMLKTTNDEYNNLCMK